jgi:exopolysaccharide biosynthesis polyprenyl glycosylphosphotransferase
MASRRKAGGEAPGSHNGGQPPGQRHRAPLASPAERLQAKRFLRIARIGDTALAVVILLGGFLASNIDRMPTGLQGFLEMRLTVRNLLLVLGYAAAWRLICVLMGLYDEKRIGDRAAEARRILMAVTAGSLLALVFPLISVTRAFSHMAIFFYWIGSAASMLLFRAGLRALLHAPLPKGHDVLIVGSGPRALTLYYSLFGERGNGFRLLGFVDSSDGEVAPEVRSRLLGNLDGLEQILMRHAVDEVLIALPVRSRYAEIQRTIEICERGGVPARYLADVFQHRRNGKQQLAAEPLSAVPAHGSSDDGRLVVKRCLDVVLGGLALICALPVLAAAALAIKLTSPGPVLFAQERYGLNKRRFRMYKLRTMVVGAETQQALLESRNEASGPVFKIREDPRITPVGRVLRRLSIDELPQLLNVLRGDMSLVGPRPLPMRDVGRFLEPALMRRFSVHPGITGLWQVSGRCELPFDDWIRLDLQYIDEWSLQLDLRILLRTVPTVVQGKGAV